MMRIDTKKTEEEKQLLLFKSGQVQIPISMINIELDKKKLLETFQHNQLSKKNIRGTNLENILLSHDNESRTQSDEVPETRRLEVSDDGKYLGMVSNNETVLIYDISSWSLAPSSKLTQKNNNNTVLEQLEEDIKSDFGNHHHDDFPLVSCFPGSSHPYYMSFPFAFSSDFVACSKKSKSEKSSATQQRSFLGNNKKQEMMLYLAREPTENEKNNNSGGGGDNNNNNSDSEDEDEKDDQEETSAAASSTTKKNFLRKSWKKQWQNIYKGTTPLDVGDDPYFCCAFRPQQQEQEEQKIYHQTCVGDSDDNDNDNNSVFSRTSFLCKTAEIAVAGGNTGSYGFVKSIRISDRKILFTKSLLDECDSLSFSSDGKLLICGVGNGTLFVYCASTGIPVLNLSTTKNQDFFMVSRFSPVVLRKQNNNNNNNSCSFSYSTAAAGRVGKILFHEFSNENFETSKIEYQQKLINEAASSSSTFSTTGEHLNTETEKIFRRSGKKYYRNVQTCPARNTKEKDFLVHEIIFCPPSYEFVAFVFSKQWGEKQETNEVHFLNTKTGKILKFAPSSSSSKNNNAAATTTSSSSVTENFTQNKIKPIKITSGLSSITFDKSGRFLFVAGDSRYIFMYPNPISSLSWVRRKVIVFLREQEEENEAATTTTTTGKSSSKMSKAFSVFRIAAISASYIPLTDDGDENENDDFDRKQQQQQVDNDEDDNNSGFDRSNSVEDYEVEENEDDDGWG